MNLASLRIATKVLLIILFMGTVSGGITGVGIWAAGELNTMTTEISDYGEYSTLAARARQSLLTLSRAEYRIAADPRMENLTEALKVVDATKKALDERLAGLTKIPDPDIQASLAKVQSQYQNYVRELGTTITAAREVSGSVDLSEAQMRVLQESQQSRGIVSDLEEEIRTLSNALIDRGNALVAEGEELYEFVFILLVCTSVVGTLAGIAIGMAISSRGVVNPIAAIVACLQNLSDGKLDTDIYGTERKDEVGDIARTTLVFRDNMVKARDLAAEQQKEQDRQIERAKLLNRAVQSFDKVISEVVEVVSAAATELESTAASLSSAAEQTAQQSNTVAAAAEQTANNVQTVAAASEELAGSIQEITSQSAEATNIVAEAVKQADATGRTVNELSNAAQRIGDVIDLINDIAAQTNLLALNATIEAARAGEAGKGFAVVASEVKTLANQTAKATDEIASQVRTIQESTQSAVKDIAAITRIIDRVSQISTSIASAMEEQGAATSEISRNVQEAASGTDEVTRNIVGVTQGAQHTSAASTQVLQSSAELSRNGARLNKEVKDFLEEVRSI